MLVYFIAGDPVQPGREGQSSKLIPVQVFENNEKCLGTKVRSELFIISLAVNVIKDAVKILFIKLAESLGILPGPLQDRILILYLRLGHALQLRSNNAKD